MKKIKTYALSLLLALYALPTFADDALISEIIRLDEARRAVALIRCWLAPHPRSSAASSIPS